VAQRRVRYLAQLVVVVKAADQCLLGAVLAVWVAQSERGELLGAGEPWGAVAPRGPAGAGLSKDPGVGLG
jgi:hypothetical protein